MDYQSRQRLAKVVKQARGNLSQHEFAQALGTSQSSIHRWEKAAESGRLTLESLTVLAAHLGQTPEELAAYLYGREFQVRSLEEIIETMPIELLPVVITAVSKRFKKAIE